MSLLSVIPISILTDSYKVALTFLSACILAHPNLTPQAGHYSQYPAAVKMVAYGEFRAAYDKDPGDSRFVFTGIRYILENYLKHQWTEEVWSYDMTCFNLTQ